MKKRTVTLADPERKLRKLEKIARSPNSTSALVRVTKEIIYLKQLLGT